MSKETESKETEAREDKKGAGVKFPPPLVLLLAIAAGFVVDYLYPVSLGVPAALQIIGAPVLVLGVALPILLSLSFRRVKTNIEPWKPTNVIITTGIYGYSRNPIYLGFCLISLGIGIWSNKLWLLMSTPIVGILIYFIAIRKEELYLESKFGDQYRQYKASVRRWI
jgi:protein-S-isoprenylcysteine O-methyltransferase Ste14